jgi:hypothetical protein
MKYFLVCKRHGVHEITEAQMMAELQRGDSPYACHKVPGCPAYTEPYEPESEIDVDPEEFDFDYM